MPACKPILLSCAMKAPLTGSIRYGTFMGYAAKAVHVGKNVAYAKVYASHS